MCNMCVQHFGDDTQALQCSMCNVQCAMCNVQCAPKGCKSCATFGSCRTKKSSAKRVAAAQCTMHNAQWTTIQLNMAQCTMHSCTWHIFWVQFVLQLGHHTMCSSLSLLGLLLVQCTASIVCSIPWRFLVFCNRSVQLIFISPCVLRLTFTACSISWLHLICKRTFCYVPVQPELLCATFIVLSVLRLSLTLYCVP